MLKKLIYWYERKIKNQDMLSEFKGAKWFVSYGRISTKKSIITSYTALIKKDTINISINQFSPKETLQDSVWIDFGHDTNNIRNFAVYLNDLIAHLESDGYDFKKEDSFLYGCPPNVSANESIEQQKAISQELYERSYNYAEKFR